MEGTRRVRRRRERPEARPWVRFWARTIDFLLVVYIVVLPLEIVRQIVGFPAELPELTIGLASLLVQALVEPVLLSTWGWTPGKALLRVRVRHEDGSKPSFAGALVRVAKVIVIGQALGLPCIGLLAQLYAYTRLKANGTTVWDRDGDFVVGHETIGPLRAAVATTFLGLSLALAVLAAYLPA